MTSIQQRLADSEIADRVLPRFQKYARFWTTSDRHIADTPSTPGQWDLAKALVLELKELGLSDVQLSDHCYVTALLPATPGCESVPALGFMAHVDTSSDVSGKDVDPQVTVNYDGSRIALKDGYYLDPAVDASLAAQIGDDIVHSDGTTLLGGDDKAGIAEIMSALEYLVRHPEVRHGPIEVIFSPDEETGKGLPDFPLDRVKAAAYYTLDGGPAGEIEVECFTAYKAEIEFKGKTIHVGYARGKLANAALMAAYYAAMLPRAESPEATDGYYGYYSLMEISGDLENAKAEVYIRDFDQAGAERRLAALEVFARAVEAQFPGGQVIVTPQLQYFNMKKKIDARPEVLDVLKQAAANAGVDVYLKPIRGGTDGSRLTEMGIPTPNIYTGGRNFHSRTEWVSVADMVAATRTVIELARLWAERKN